jgi:hypothetical protein
MRMFLLLLLLVTTQALRAAEAPQVATFTTAMAGQDFQAKRAAISSLSSVKDDEVVYKLLIGAVADRQSSKLAIQALRSRSGLQPSSVKGGNTGYPGYPADDSAGAWGAWNQARKAELEAKAKLAEALAKAEEAKRKAENPDGEATEPGAEGETGTEGGEAGEGGEGGEGALTTTQAAIPAELLGKLDRIFFKDGSILVGYITVYRRDMTGRLTSIHIVHGNQAGGGEEDVEAELISRIEDDIE